MKQESDFRSQLVLDICSLPTRSIACVHRHPRSPSKSLFIDWYRLLGVEENADIDVIRKRYHKLALQLHPDKNKHPKAEIAFKLVLEAYSCLSDNVKRKAFNLERWKNFCIECNRIPYIPCNSYSNASASELRERNPAYFSRSYRSAKYLKEIKERFKEEARVMESCLKASGALRKESPLCNPSDHLFQSSTHCRFQKESPIFDPSDYLFQGYPHIRNRIYNEPENFWCLRRKEILNNVQGRGRLDSPIFENRSDRGMFRSKSTCVRS